MIWFIFYICCFPLDWFVHLPSINLRLTRRWRFHALDNNRDPNTDFPPKPPLAMPSNKLFAQLLSKFEPNDVPLPIELGCNSVDHVTAAPATVPSTRQGKIIKSRPITGEKLQPDFQSRLSLLSQANPPQIPLPDGRGCVATVAGKLVGVSSSEGSVHNLQRRSVVAEKRKLFEKEQRREAIEVGKSLHFPHSVPRNYSPIA